MITTLFLNFLNKKKKYYKKNLKTGKALNRIKN